MSSAKQSQDNQQRHAGSKARWTLLVAAVTTFLVVGAMARTNDQAAASEGSQTFLPVVANRWPLPFPGQLTISDIDNNDNDRNYLVDWEKDPEDLSDQYVLEESECNYWCDEFNHSIATVAYDGAETSTSITGQTPGTYLYRVRGKNASGYGEYSETKLVTVVPDPTASFAATVSQLDTPGKISGYLRDEFRYSFHDGCIAYWPEEFHNLKNGDCKDFATLSSYLLSQHGYRAEVVSFSWYGQDGSRYGHVVVIYQNADGTLQYMSNGEIMAQVTSVSDLLEKERQRLNASRIGGNITLPPGTKIVCAKN